MTELKRVDKVEKLVRGFDPYSRDLEVELFSKYGCKGSKGNFCLDNKPSEEEIKKIRDLISEQDGMLKEYMLWWCEPINNWRLVFGLRTP